MTHGVNLVKGRLFAEQRLRCIEIDLSGHRYKDDAEIAAAVRSSAPRRWIWKKPPMPIKRPELPKGPVPRRGSFKRSAPPEIDVEGWADFNRRHPAARGPHARARRPISVDEPRIARVRADEVAAQDCQLLPPCAR